MMKGYFYMRMISLLGALLALCFFTGCGDRNKAAGEKPPVVVRTAKLSSRSFQDFAATQGVVEPTEYAVLSALVPGRIDGLRAEEGTRVKKGELLFCSDRENLENACTLAEETLKLARTRLRHRTADRELAKVSCEKAETDLKRNRKLHKSGSVADSVLENYVLAWRKARVAVEQAEAAFASASAETGMAESALRMARKKLADAFVRAPYDAVVTAKLRRSGEFCGAGTPVLKIENPAKKRICAVLSAVHYPAAASGKARIELSLGGRVQCRVPVTSVSPAVDPLSRTFEVKGDLPAGAELPSGTLCDVRVIFGEHRSAALPEEALLFRQDGRFAVFAVRDGRAEEIFLRPGVTREGFTEIIDPGKIAGREIVVSGHYFLNAGTPVSVRTK